MRSPALGPLALLAWPALVALAASGPGCGNGGEERYADSDGAAGNVASDGAAGQADGSSPDATDPSDGLFLESDGGVTSSGADGSVQPGTGGEGGAGATTLRLIAPLSTSRVTSRRPTLHWLLPPGTPDATVDLCLDRGCTKPIGAPAHVTGTSYAPPSDLPTGVVYWRVHPLTSTALVTPTWQFTVGARTAAVDTSWGTTLDVNGDGYADVAIAAPNAISAWDTGTVSLYLGSAGGLSTTPAATLIGSASGYGASAASAGDVNGDGYADLVVGAWMGIGSVFVYFGSASGLAVNPAVVLVGLADSSSFGGQVASAGDVNGDGYADIAVGAATTSGSLGSAFVYLGGPAGPQATPATTLSPPDTASCLSNNDGIQCDFGASLAGAGDVNGDGYGDLLVGAPFAASQQGVAYLFLGGPGGLAATASATFENPPPNDPPWGFGTSVAGAGDVNGDGRADIVIGTAVSSSTIGAGVAFVFLGDADPKAMASSMATKLLDAQPSGTETLGVAVASAGDINGDGFADVVVGQALEMATRGLVYLFNGSAAGIVPASPPTLSLAADEAFGVAVASAGDVNGDGYSDLVVGDDGVLVTGSFGSASVWSGGDGGIASTPPPIVLTGPLADSLYGFAVSGATD